MVIVSGDEDWNHDYWVFIQGFVLGQVMVFFLMYILFKYWFLDDATKRIYSSPPSVAPKLKASLDRKRELNQNVLKNFKSQRASLSIADAEVLSKTLYELLEHGAESCDWLNVIIAQIINKYRNDLLTSEYFVNALTKLLNSELKPSMLGGITLNDLCFGQEFPLLKDVVIKHKSDSTTVFAELSVEYNDRISIGFDSSILIGARGLTLAALPISLTLSFTKFIGKITIEFETDIDSPALFLSVQPEYDLDFEVNSLLGHRSKLKDLPKVAAMIIYRLKSVFQNLLVYPHGKRVPFPNIDNILRRTQPTTDVTTSEKISGERIPLSSEILIQQQQDVSCMT